MFMDLVAAGLGKQLLGTVGQTLGMAAGVVTLVPLTLAVAEVADIPATLLALVARAGS